MIILTVKKWTTKNILKLEVEKLTHYIEQIYKVNFGLPLLMKMNLSSLDVQRKN
jgi:hypothetical protein